MEEEKMELKMITEYIAKFLKKVRKEEFGIIFLILKAMGISFKREQR